jgi:hypothetical protein
VGESSFLNAWVATAILAGFAENVNGFGGHFFAGRCEIKFLPGANQKTWKV